MKQKGNRYCYPRSDKLESNRLRTWVTDCMFSIETRNPKHEIRNNDQIFKIQMTKTIDKRIISPQSVTF